MLGAMTVTQHELGIQGFTYSTVLDPRDDSNARLLGFVFWHLSAGEPPQDDLPPAPLGSECACYLPVDRIGPADNPRTFWTVKSIMPLTLEPSIVCRRCGLHVFITEGRVIA
jgi:hypothetical protein